MNQSMNNQSQSPFLVLKEKSILWGLPLDSEEFAERLDEEDHLRGFRDMFCVPTKSEIPYLDTKKAAPNNESCLYFCGQSLGLKPKSVDSAVSEVLMTWGQSGVHSHFKGNLPAAYADIAPKAPMARVVGANESEVAIMNGLSVNLHILFATFYRPNQQRHKIIIEEHAFSSDIGEYIIRQEDALKVIEEHGSSTAVILLPGIQYYTGQKFDVPKLTAAAHAQGIIVGCDMAHAAGNIPLHLHDWDVDFAAWCTYKYLNSGAGCIGAIFIHEKWTLSNTDPDHFPMLRGWWGNAIKTKFQMNENFEHSYGADMLKLSNPPVVLCSMLMASLDIFSKTSMQDISKKQFLLTGYMEYLLKSTFNQTNNQNQAIPKNGLPTMEIITPSDPTQRGSQLSVMFSIPLTIVQEELQKIGVVVDIRKPSVMRIAPAPLYNSFLDVQRFVKALESVCSELGRNQIKHCAITDNDTGIVIDAGFNSPSLSPSTSMNATSSDSESDSLFGSNTL